MYGSESRLRQLFEERRKHQPLVHPASKEQLEDLWQKHDGMKDEDFNAKTFFNLHGMEEMRSKYFTTGGHCVVLNHCFYGGVTVNVH